MKARRNEFEEGTGSNFGRRTRSGGGVVGLRPGEGSGGNGPIALGLDFFGFSDQAACLRRPDGTSRHDAQRRKTGKNPIPGVAGWIRRRGFGVSIVFRQ